MRRIAHVLIAACLAVLVFSPSPSQAATARSISFNASRSSVFVGQTFKLSGRVTHSPKGTKVKIERRTSGAWTLVKTVTTTNRTGSFAWSGAKLGRAGTFMFRARVTKSGSRAAAKSAVRNVQASYPRGTLSNPYSVGEGFAFGAWRFRVGATDTDAWPEIAAENQFNEAPAAGWSYITAPVTFTHLTTGYGDPFWETDWTFVGTDGRAYDYDNSGGDCGVVPEDYLNIGDLYQGASATGNVCAVVPTSYVEGGRWRVTTDAVYGQYRHVRMR